MALNTDKNHTITLLLTVEKDRIATFFPLLTQGFTVKTKVGYSVRELLCTQIGLSADYLENRLQTIFLDGKAVDNVSAAVVRQNATLALSAAMPGLAGATLRRGGFYSPMRHQITHKTNAGDDIIEDGTIVLKLFNLVTRDIGPMFLTQGIWINGKSLQVFFQRAPNHFWTGCRAAEIDGMHVEVDKLAHMDWERKQVFLKLEVSQAV